VGSISSDGYINFLSITCDCYYCFLEVKNYFYYNKVNEKKNKVLFGILQTPTHAIFTAVFHENLCQLVASFDLSCPFIPVHPLKTGKDYISFFTQSQQVFLVSA